MKQNITFCNFCDAFPESRETNFSYEGKKALFEYLENYEEDTDTQIDLDIIALCCEYCEYNDVDDYLSNYDSDIDKEEYTDEEDSLDTEEYHQAVLNEIEQKTQLIKFENSNGFIIQSY